MPDILPNFNPEKYQWLRARKAIDLLSLDDEVMQIPVLIQECGEQTAIAVEIRETAKDDLKKIESVVGSEIRALSKSESAITSMTPSDERVVAANRLLSEARLDAGLWQSLMDSLRTKAANLRVATDLISAGYITQSSIMEKRRRELRDKS